MSQASCIDQSKNLFWSWISWQQMLISQQSIISNESKRKNWQEIALSKNIVFYCSNQLLYMGCVLIDVSPISYFVCTSWWLCQAHYAWNSPCSLFYWMFRNRLFTSTLVWESCASLICQLHFADHAPSMVPDIKSSLWFWVAISELYAILYFSNFVEIFWNKHNFFLP